MVSVKTIRRTIFVSVMSVLIVLAMVPAMAFAATTTNSETVTVTAEEGIAGTYTSSITMAAPDNMANGDQQMLSYSDVTTNYPSTTHVDWSVVAGTGSASISKHNGRLTANSAGTVTVTATLRIGAKESSGTGTGQNAPCSGKALVSVSQQINIATATTYGFQGTGGNSLKMLTPNNITGGVVYTDSTNTTVDHWYNTVNDDIELESDGSFNVGFTMSAGINNFDASAFNAHVGQYVTMEKSGDSVDCEASFVSIGTNADGVKEITMNVKALDEDEEPVFFNEDDDYVLVFGSSVCGNNATKTLGHDIQFAISLVE